jgi:hypothetical protein
MKTCTTITNTMTTTKATTTITWWSRNSNNNNSSWVQSHNNPATLESIQLQLLYTILAISMECQNCGIHTSDNLVSRYDIPNCRSSLILMPRTCSPVKPIFRFNSLRNHHTPKANHELKHIIVHCCRHHYHTTTDFATSASTPQTAAQIAASNCN